MTQQLPWLTALIDLLPIINIGRSNKLGAVSIRHNVGYKYDYDRAACRQNDILNGKNRRERNAAHTTAVVKRREMFVW